MTAWINYDERFPFITIGREGEDGGKGAEISPELLAKYQRVMGEFESLQKELERIWAAHCVEMQRARDKSL